MEVHNCPDCGTPLTKSAVEGMCPTCLAGLLFGSDSPEAQDPGASAKPTKPAAISSRFPGLSSKSGPPSSSGSTFAGPAQPAPVPTAPKDLLHVPGHVVTAEIARGGMGIVYRATQLEPRREVALKMLLASQLGIQHLRNHFLLEARAIARLDHPNILPIYQLGEYEGIPFFTMKLATHGSLSHRRSRYRGQWTQIAELMATLADAVGYAHQRGVLHRDLKPGNALFDDTNRPYVTDFGLARVFEGEESTEAEGTHLVGTPKYMSPEVIEGGADAATTASDVYALGLIFYELLAQRGPFEAANEHEHMRRVLSEPIPRPSTFVPRIPVELERLCLSCLEHDRSQRLPSATLLRDELRRWLTGKPMHQQKLGGVDRLRRWTQRNALLTWSSIVAITGAVVALVAGGLAVNRLVHFNRMKAQTEERSAEYLVGHHLGIARRIRQDGWLGRSGEALALLKEAALTRTNEPLRTEAVAQLTLPGLGEETARHSLGSDAVRVEASPDLELLAAAGAGGELRVWRRSLSKLLWQLKVPGARIPRVLEFNPAGDFLAVGPEVSEVTVYDAKSGQKIRSFRGEWLGFEAGNRNVVTRELSEIRHLDIGTGELVSSTRLPNGSPITGRLVLGQGKAAPGVMVPRAEGVELVAGDGSVLARLPGVQLQPQATVWDGRRVIVGEPTGQIRLWQLPNLTPLVLSAHRSPVDRLWLEPATDRLWSRSEDGAVWWWDLRAGTPIGKAPGWIPVQPSLDGRQILTSEGRAASLYPLNRRVGQLLLELTTGAPVRHLEFGPGGVWLLTVQDGEIGLWETAGGRRLASLPARGAQSVHLSVAGNRLAVVETNQVRWVAVNSSVDGFELREFRPPQPLPGGAGEQGRLAARPGQALLTDARNQLYSLDVEHGDLVRLATSISSDVWVTGNDGARILACSSRARGTWAVTRSDGRQLFTQNEHWGPLTFSPDGQRLLQPGAGEHRMLEVATGQVLWSAPAEPGVPGSGLAAWPADARYLASATRGGAIQILDSDTGLPLLKLNPSGPLTALAVSGDGRNIAAAFGPGGVMVWNLPVLKTALQGLGMDLPFDNDPGPVSPK